MGYTNQQLFAIARENYGTLLFHCVKLQSDGYWDKPGRLLHLTIQEQLDMYLQAFLVSCCVRAGHFTSGECQFVRSIPDSNMLEIHEDEKMNRELSDAAAKVLNSPPILIQLFSLRDREKHTGLAVMFMDTVINIVIAMNMLDGREGTEAAGFLRQYFEKNEAFLSAELLYLKDIDPVYVQRKAESPTFKTGYVRDEKELARRLSPSPQMVQDFRKKVQENASEDSYKAVTGSPEETEEPEAPALTDQEIEEATRKARLELEQTRDAKRAEAVQAVMDELNQLVGLDSVKQEMQSLVNLIKVRKMRRNYHMPEMDMSYHMVFTGNAGTGKTTVARLVARIYKELGVLSGGQLIETDRAGLVAGYLGQTAMKVKEVVNQALGGVLFIDEAYSLTSRDAGDDYGIEAVDTLVKEMEDHRDDLVVIVAGYRDEMKKFLKSNTGLVSRFNKYIDFPDYTDDQLIDILKSMAGRAGLEIEDQGFDSIRTMLSSMDQDQRNDFGNARGIRNLFEKIVTAQANRIITMENPDEADLRLIKREDVDRVIIG